MVLLCLMGSIVLRQHFSIMLHELIELLAFLYEDAKKRRKLGCFINQLFDELLSVFLVRIDVNSIRKEGIL